MTYADCLCAGLEECREEVRILRSPNEKLHTKHGMKVAGHVAPKGKRAQFLLENIKERDHLGNLGVDGRMILKRIIREMDYEDRNSIQLAHESRLSPRWSFCGSSSCSIKAWNFLIC
jgi:hypothetical protein